jgi:SAM-dependent methyltransferase
MPFDLIYSCDTVEHVAAPERFFRNLHDALRPGGRVFIAFPNEHPDVAHGITFFERTETLRKLVQEAAFDPAAIQIETIRLSSAAKRTFQIGWYRPRRLAKTILKALRPKRPAADGAANNLHPTDEPQTFDQTDFFTLGKRLEVLAPAVNAYCWAVLRLASQARPVYEVHPAPDVLWNTTVLIRARRRMGGE